MKDNGAFGQSGVEQVNEKFAKDAKMTENLEYDDEEKTYEEVEDNEE